ncbi:MAG: glycerol-3-phosphate 1-O-acyltransferase PlsY, partial [Planctomycetota bacterium]|nr:glycerol-3-phosphate 1-O-acyltransferase PlsY [Planctomycetota bacterium]
GQDVRRHGSGNPGATNAARMWPKRWQLPIFVMIFLLDAGKGYLASGMLPRLFESLDADAPALAGAAAVVGHIFTPFLKLKGGKGVATTIGVLLALEPIATLIAVALFFAVFLTTRIVALGSLIVAVALPAAVYFRGVAPQSTLTLTIVLGLLIIVRHKGNIERMLRGAEA